MVSQPPNQSRTTPDDLFKALDARYGPLMIDVAATQANSKCVFYIDEEMDALAASTSWCDSLRYKSKITGMLEVYGFEYAAAFCNPPWKKPVPWLKKAYAESRLRRGTNIVVVLHQTWSKGVAPWLNKAAYVDQLVGRPKFMIPEGWYLCRNKKCKHFFESALWPNKVGACCPLCSTSDSKPQLNSSSPRDIQIVVFNASVTGPTTFRLWDWTKQL